jgi:DNA-binding LacI/PurR family transcriptional regulator
MDGPSIPRTFASAKQVAELAGVSRSAVSRAFTPGTSISEETRRRVVMAAEQLGYHVNHLARGLLRNSSGIVCLVVADSDTPYQARMVRKLSQHLQDAGKVPMVLETSGSRDNVEGALRQTLNYRADATVVLSGTPPQSVIRTCLDSGQRLLLINRDDGLIGPHNIRLDNASATRIALHALLRAGCRRLAVVTSEAGTPSLIDRERSFARLASEVGAEPTVWRSGRTSYETGAAGARALLAGADRPDAAFCVTDLIACGFMDCARHEFGIAIPEELCVIGFDDIDQAGWASYRLTTFAPPVDAIASRVVELVTADPSEKPEESVFEAPVVWRASVRPKADRGRLAMGQSRRD